MNLLHGRRAGWAALAAIVVALATAVYAFAGHQPSDVQSYTGCLSSGGTISSMQLGNDPLKPCGGQSQQIHVSGGDVTSVVAGSGLTGGGDGGAVTLSVDAAAIDPSTVQRRVSGSCADGGAISQINQDGTVECATGPAIFERALGEGDVPNDSATIGSLPLPPGKFLIMAKLTVSPSAVGTNTDDFWDVECTLGAGNDSDSAAEADDTSDFHFSRFGTMSMIVTHEFTDPGNAHVDCQDLGDHSFFIDADFNDLVITAVQVGDIQHP